MTSKKPSARAKERARFDAALDLDAMDEVFAREERHHEEAAVEREEAAYEKACASKNRYASAAEAREAVRLCEEHGTRGLRIYKCRYCNGWHLTSHPWES